MRAIAVAKYLIQKSRETERSGEYRQMSHLKLQKILYYAQGWHLGLYGKPLFEDPIYAWKLGPVTESVYYDLRHFGDMNLVDADYNCSTGTTVTDPEKKVFIDHAWDEYAEESANALVARTHSSEPWLNSFSNPFSKEIDPEAMEEHFRKTI